VTSTAVSSKRRSLDIAARHAIVTALFRNLY